MRTPVVVSALSAAVASSVGAVLINLATDWKTDPWAWLGVGAVTVLGGLLSWRQTRRTSAADVVIVSDEPNPSVRLLAAPVPSDGPSEVDGTAVEWTDDGPPPATHTGRTALDVKLINRGTGVAFLHHFEVRILDVVPDEAPHLETERIVLRRGVRITAHNRGWGPARSVTVRPESWVVPEIGAMTRMRAFRRTVEPGRTRSVAVLRPRVKGPVLDALLARRDRRHHEIRAALRAGEPVATDPDDVLLSQYCARLVRGAADGTLTAEQLTYLTEIADADPGPLLPVRTDYELSHVDALDRRHTTPLRRWGSEYTGSDHGCSASDTLWLGRAGFEFRSWETPVPRFSSHNVKLSYGVVLPCERNWARSYPISHVLAPNEAERFYILIEARRSGRYRVQISFRVNEGSVVRSRARTLDLWHTAGHLNTLPDGSTLRRAEPDRGRGPGWEGPRPFVVDE